LIKCGDEYIFVKSKESGWICLILGVWLCDDILTGIFWRVVTVHFFIRGYENGITVMWGLYTICEKVPFLNSTDLVGILKNVVKGGEWREVSDAGSWEDFWL
jgi:hypothetical protein